MSQPLYIACPIVMRLGGLTHSACISDVDEAGYIRLAVAVNILSGEENQTQLHLVASP